MAETTFLTAVASYLQSASLTPTPATVGIAEPASASELPAVVLSLERTERQGSGLGGRISLVTGALGLQASIDLANPVLPEDPGLRLLDPARTLLTLPHGGLVRSDGSHGALSPDDIAVAVAGVPRNLVGGPPVGPNFSVDPLVGRLQFGVPLPASGLVVVSYFVGQWERHVERITGELRIDACAQNSADVATLGGALVDAMLAPTAKAAIVRLLAVSVSSLSSIGVSEPPSQMRRRTQRFAFTFENEINRAESSGGLILEIPVNTAFMAET